MFLSVMFRDQLNPPMDFNALLVENQAATFAFRVASDRLTGAGLFPKDILIVNKARDPEDGTIVVALFVGTFTLRRLRWRGGQVTLQAENPDYPDVVVTDRMDFEIWAVLAFSIRRHAP